MGNAGARYLAATLILPITACMPYRNTEPEIHGHRGSRGLEPENTIPAFIKGAEEGCDWLELDVVMTGDGHVLVSHEPWIDHRICLDPKGDRIPADGDRQLNIFRMSLEEVQAYDCGTLKNPDFPDQQHEVLYKPTLAEVVEAVDDHTMAVGSNVGGYNIEIKSDPAWYGIYQPEPTDYAAQVLAEIEESGITDRCMIQSFDPAILEAVHNTSPWVRLALLVDNADGLDANLARLSFKPAVYSPHYTLADEKMVNDLWERDIELAVWTVNDKDEIERIVKLGVDAVISDYPDRVRKVIDQLN